VERTRLLVPVLDLAPLDGSEPRENFATIEAELAAHAARLARLPRILALSKADLVPGDAAEAAAAEWRERLGDDVPVVVTSSATALGLDTLAAELLRRVPIERAAAAEQLAAENELAEHRVFRPAAGTGWRVDRRDEGGFVVTGEPVERLLQRFDVENDEAMAHVERRLHRMGVVRALEAAGFEPGDDVEIAGVVFELDPG
jgi:GTPase